MNTTYHCGDCGLDFEAPVYVPKAPKVECPESKNHGTVIARDEVAGIVNSSKGKFFTIEFAKRTTGETRVLTARTGVKKHLRGGKPAYNAAEKGLIVVWEPTSGGYRSFPIDSVIALTFGGKRMVVR